MTSTVGEGSPPARDVVSPPSDRALSAQLDEIVRRFSGSIRATSARYRLDPSDVGEAEQEVRIRLWRACGDPENISKLSASYLQRVVTTAVLDLLRRRRRTAMHDPVEDLPLPAPGPGPDADVEAASLGIIVQAGVESLGLARRTVVKLHLEGFRREEIEALLGWSEAKTRNLLYRGLSDLRDSLVARGISWGNEA